jgi:PKD repeat protein
LGTIYPSDTESGAKPYWVEYNTNLKIPEDTEIHGKARLYVQYSGTHWKSHWHWSIAYQPAFVKTNHAPYTEEHRVKNPNNANYCRASKGELVIDYVPKWTFKDDNDDYDDTMQAYKIQLRNEANNTGLWEIRGLDIPDSQTVQRPLEVRTNEQLSSDPDESLFVEYNQVYDWRVDVQDSIGAWSDWSTWQEMQIRPRYPRAQFSFEPKDPVINTEITFDGSESKAFDGSQAKLSWDFDGDGTWEINSTTSKVATYSYNETGNYTIILKVEDESPETSSCSEQKDIKIKPKPGPREEVIPR